MFFIEVRCKLKNLESVESLGTTNRVTKFIRFDHFTLMFVCLFLMHEHSINSILKY